MSRRSESKLTIRGDFASTGINMTASPSIMPENVLSKTTDAYCDLKGILRKRPEFVQWGQTLYSPTQIDKSDSPAQSVAYQLAVNDDNITNPDSNDGGAYAYQENYGYVKAYAYYSTEENNIHSSMFIGIPSNQELSATRKKLTFLMSFQSSSLTKAADPTLGSGIMFAFQANSNKPRMFALTSSSLWYFNSGGTPTERDLGVTLDDSAPHTLAISIDTNELATITVDGAQVDQFTWTDYYGGLFLSTTYLAMVRAGNAGMASGDYMTMKIGNIIIRDEEFDDGIVAEKVNDIHTFDNLVPNSFDIRRRLLAVTDKNLWIDHTYSNLWVRFDDLIYNQSQLFSFRGDLFLINKAEQDTDTRLFKITTDGLQELTTAPNIRFGLEHDARVWGFGDYEKPGRLYFSGDRNASIWMEDDPLDAGFIDIPLADGEHVTAARSFTGELIVYTTLANIWRISGAGGVTEYSRAMFKENIGAYSQRTVSPVANDLWACGPDGISALTATDQYGDLLYAKVSLPIQGLFTNLGRDTADVNTEPDYVGLTYNPAKGLVYLSFSDTDDTGYSSRLFVTTPDGQKWYGPWKINHTCMAMAAVGFPFERALMIGNSSGQIFYDAFFEDDTATISLESAHINGRSIDPKIMSMKKRWSTMRILHTPRGKWDMTVYWRVDHDPWKSRSITLLPSELDAIGDDWEVADSVVPSEYTTCVAEFPLDCRGREIKFKLEFSDASIGLIGWEIDHIVSGNEVD